MIAAILGFVSQVEQYEAKNNEPVVEMVHVAAGEFMMRVRCPEDAHFEEMDRVCIAGELKVFEKRPYLRGATIRLATASDEAFFREARVNAADAEEPLAGGGAANTPIAQHNAKLAAEKQDKASV